MIPLFQKRFQLTMMRTKLLLMMIIVFKFLMMETIYSIQVSYDAPTTIHENKFAYVESSKISMLVDHENNALCDGYIVEFIHDATENYYEGGIYACRNCNNIKFPLYMLKTLKLCLFCLPMLVDSCSHK